MSSFRSSIVTVVWLTLAAQTSADWSTFQHDNARSGATDAAIPHDPIAAWVYRAPARPRPAWDEPALWDGWSKTHNLTNRQVYDKALHVVTQGDRVFFGSSVDDKVYCLDAQSGDEIWSFFTEGPVRLAPTLDKDVIYFGSDDGFVYALRADTGGLIWKHRPGPTARRLPGNERMISPWAIRTGVVVEGKRLYCGAGVIPSETVFICALDAATGSEIWKTEMEDLPAQGYMLASPTRLYVVTGRNRPLVFDTQTGERLQQLGGGTGGTYALLTGDNLLYGPNKTGDVNLVGANNDVLASFAGEHMIVAQPLSYLYGERHLSALDRSAYVTTYAQRTAIMKSIDQTQKEIKAAEAKAKKLAEGTPNSGTTDEPDQVEGAKIDAEIETLQTELKRLEGEKKSLTERLTGCIQWRIPCDCPISLVLAENALLAGGDGNVMAVDRDTGETLWRRDVAGKAFGLAVDDGRFFVSTDDGSIYCFVDRGSDVEPIEITPNDDRPVRLQQYIGPYSSENEPPAEILGPIAEFTKPGEVRIWWETTEPMTSQLEFGVGLQSRQQMASPDLATEHEFLVTGVQRDIVYRFRVGGTNAGGIEILTDPYQFDAHFDYLPVTTANVSNPYRRDAKSKQYEELAHHLIHLAGTRRGYALVLGSRDGQLAYHLAQASELQIVVVEPHAQNVATVRDMIDRTGLHGARISVHHSDQLPFGPYLFNLIVADPSLASESIPFPYGEVTELMRPAGGTLAVGHWLKDDQVDLDQLLHTWSGSDRESWQQIDWTEATFAYKKRGELANTAEWSHAYASADNSSCSQDAEVGGPLAVQWWGRPGARPMPDRGNRNPPPVSANGRLYVQGNRTLFGIDAYNGAILWCKQIPTMRRANMPRDGSNMVAVEDQLFVAVGHKCLAFDGQTGKMARMQGVPVAQEGHAYDWGHVSRVDSLLFGTGQRKGSHYRGDKGEWYQGFKANDVARVNSDYLFATEWYGGETKWLYRDGVIMNSTITLGDGKIYFIESRNEAAKVPASGRMLDEILQSQVLVALDAQTGQRVWEKPFDFSKCSAVTYLVYSNDTLIASGTDAKGTFHTYAFDGSSGDLLWQHEATDQKGHHTGHLAHPTIVGDRVYFNKHTYQLRTGEVLDVHKFNWHGCGVMSASTRAIFSRYEYHGMFDLQTKSRTEFLGLRSGCWLSLIPSGGLLLAPETSAGCSCGPRATDVDRLRATRKTRLGMSRHAPKSNRSHPSGDGWNRVHSRKHVVSHGMGGWGRVFEPHWHQDRPLNAKLSAIRHNNVSNASLRVSEIPRPLLTRIHPENNAFGFAVASLDAHVRSIFSPSPIAGLRKNGLWANADSTQTRVWERGSGGEGPKSHTYQY